ncbi:MAG: DUF3310 domain-containing protein [Verrucomicrobia bacterium]|nr:DUF3310 domain-containing protein [Verrucomicrobiota bacterium]
MQVAGGHYKKLVIQPAEYCHRNGLGFCESSAIKYITRHRDKGRAEDIQKAIHFLHLLLEFDYPGDENPAWNEVHEDHFSLITKRDARDAGNIPFRKNKNIKTHTI